MDIDKINALIGKTIDFRDGFNGSHTSINVVKVSFNGSMYANLTDDRGGLICLPLHKVDELLTNGMCECEYNYECYFVDRFWIRDDNR